ncbi:MAG TPA: ABC transporter permease, partial [Candidatus Sulfotelmatobacter sp.]
MLRQAPGFAAVTILTLAIGIGATTAFFSVINAVLLKPLPYARSEQLVDLSESNPERGVNGAGCSFLDLEEFQRSGVFADIAGIARHKLTLTGSGDPTEVATVTVTPEIFRILDTNPFAGRYLLEEDGKKGAGAVVVVSEGLWRTRYGASPDFVGSSILLDQRPFTVVGIMPASFQIPVFGGHQEIWIPMAQDPVFSVFMLNREIRGFFAVARLKTGESVARAQAEAQSVSEALAKEFPEDAGFSVGLTPLQTAIFGDIKAPLLVLLGAVGLVLLLACVNIANLMLARAASRTRELALRQALGAGRGRIIRQLLTESALVGLIGSAVGLAIAVVSARALAMLLPKDLPAMGVVQVDLRVLAFALLLSLAAVVAFGLIPAILATDSNMQSYLKDSSARTGTGGRSRTGRALATAEIGLATVIVVAAGLLVRSLLTMTAVNPGFNPEHVLKAQVSLPRYQYSTPQQWTAFSNSFLERIQAEPGMQDSAIGIPSPLADPFAALPFSIADHAPLPPGTPSTAHYVAVSPEYFQLMGIP